MVACTADHLGVHLGLLQACRVLVGEALLEERVQLRAHGRQLGDEPGGVVGTQQGVGRALLAGLPVVHEQQRDARFACRQPGRGQHHGPCLPGTSHKHIHNASDSNGHDGHAS